MNVTAPNSEPHNIKKKLFTLKPIQKNGLILQIHNTNWKYSISQKRNLPFRVRFINTSFDITGKIFAASDVTGNVFIIDFENEKYWLLPNLETCSVLKFSSQNSNDLLIGRQNGQILILNIHTGVVHTVWEDHYDPVKNISFAQEKCLASSMQEAIIYEMCTFQKLHTLSLKDCAKLSYVVFTPVHNYILMCFADSYINVWESKHFRSIRQILPTTWKKRLVRCFAFTRNGQLMVLAGKSNFLLIFSFQTWNLERTISVPLSLRSIKQIDFIPQDHDGGANRVLAILSSDGVLYMYDMDFNFVLNETRLEGEISSFQVSPFGNMIACVLHSGEVNFYKSTMLIKNYFMQTEEDYKVQQKLKLYLPQPKKLTDIMDTNKLRSILLKYGEFPITYRTTIWSKILKLPNNRQCFVSVINRLDEDHYPNLEREYPLLNKRSLKNLKRTLNNIAIWYPFFTNVDFLPLFVFPFIKVFENDPIQAFECAITVIINWCQHWFENTPTPPINILAFLENILYQHDPQLMHHFRQYKITSALYGWTLLEVAFSEVLTINEWQILWDHIVSNEPSFILFVPVAYNIINRSTLLSFTKVEEFEAFFHSQNSITLKRFIWKIYNLNDLTTEDIHPSQYLKCFTPLTSPEYPVFLQYNQCEETRMSGGQDLGTPSSLESKKKSDDPRKLELFINNCESEDFQLANDQEISNESGTGPPLIEEEIPEKPIKAKKRLSIILTQIDQLNKYNEKDLNKIQKKIDENLNKLLAQKQKLQKIIENKQQKEVPKSQKKTVTYRTKAKSGSPDRLMKKLKNNNKTQTCPEKKISKLEKVTVELEKQVQQLLKKQPHVTTSDTTTAKSTNSKKPSIKKKKQH